MIFETIKLVSKIKASIHQVPASSLQFLDPTSKDPQPILGDRRALDSVVSDQSLSERKMRQLEGIGGGFADTNANISLYMSGRFIGQSKCPVLQTVMARSPSTMRNGKY